MENRLLPPKITEKLLWLFGLLPKWKIKNEASDSSLSNGSLLIKKIASWSDTDNLAKHCFLTARFLKKTGQMEAISNRYFQSRTTSIGIEEIRPRFLTWLEKNTDGLTSILARFEKGLTAINNGQAYCDEFLWPCDPIPLIHGLVTESLSTDSIQPGTYLMKLSDKILSTFEVEKIDL